MKEHSLQKSDGFIIDTYHRLSDDVFVAGAVLFKGRRQIDAIQWGHLTFASSEQADTFVRKHCKKLGLREAEHVDDLVRSGR